VAHNIRILASGEFAIPPVQADVAAEHALAAE
jgi:hypothetical protein